MSMIENYQERQELAEKVPEGLLFAEVAGVYSDGLSLILPPQTTPSEKHFKCNTAVKFEVGQRVKILWDSGTYVVEYPIGNPISLLVADGVKSQDNKKEVITLTCNKSKKTYAIICTGIRYWKDFTTYTS